MNLESIRREYLQGGLQREDLADNPFRQFESWMDVAVKADLGPDTTAMTIATASASGVPSQRVVLLKHFDDQGFVFYTNFKSQKAQDLADNPQANLHFSWLVLERQISITGQVEKLDQAASQKYFQSRPRPSQIAAWASEQSHPIPDRSALEHKYQEEEKRFSEQEIPLPDFWGGYRVIPTRFEFWQGRANRLHDRFEYRKEDHGWEIQRLQP